MVIALWRGQQYCPQMEYSWRLLAQALFFVWQSGFNLLIILVIYAVWNKSIIVSMNHNWYDYWKTNLIKELDKPEYLLSCLYKDHILCLYSGYYFMLLSLLEHEFTNNKEYIFCWSLCILITSKIRVDIIRNSNNSVTQSSMRTESI